MTQLLFGINLSEIRSENSEATGLCCLVGDGNKVYQAFGLWIPMDGILT